MESLGEPCVLLIRRYRFPLDIAVMFFFTEIAILFFLTPELVNASVENFGSRICTVFLFNEKIDAYTDLDSKDVVRCAGELGVLANIPTQIENVNRVKTIYQMFSHSVKCHAVEEPVVRYQCYNTFIADPI